MSSTTSHPAIKPSGCGCAAEACCGGGCGRGERAARRAVGVSRRGGWRGRAAGAFCGVVRRQREESGGSVQGGARVTRETGGCSEGQRRGRAAGACGGSEKGERGQGCCGGARRGRVAEACGGVCGGGSDGRWRRGLASGGAERRWRAGGREWHAGVGWAAGGLGRGPSVCLVASMSSGV